jgi:hypothetical protein
MRNQEQTRSCRLSRNAIWWVYFLQFVMPMRGQSRTCRTVALGPHVNRPWPGPEHGTRRLLLFDPLLQILSTLSLFISITLGAFSTSHFLASSLPSSVEPDTHGSPLLLLYHSLFRSVQFPLACVPSPFDRIQFLHLNTFNGLHHALLLSCHRPFANARRQGSRNTGFDVDDFRCLWQS